MHLQRTLTAEDSVTEHALVGVRDLFVDVLHQLLKLWGFRGLHRIKEAQWWEFSFLRVERQWRGTGVGRRWGDGFGCSGQRWDCGAGCFCHWGGSQPQGAALRQVYSLCFRYIGCFLLQVRQWRLWNRREMSLAASVVRWQRHTFTRRRLVGRPNGWCYTYRVIWASDTGNSGGQRKTHGGRQSCYNRFAIKPRGDGFFWREGHSIGNPRTRWHVV